MFWHHTLRDRQYLAYASSQGARQLKRHPNCEKTTSIKPWFFLKPEQHGMLLIVTNDKMTCSNLRMI